MSKKERTPKQKVIRWVLPPVLGAAFGALAVFISEWLIRNMSTILSSFADMAGIPEADLKPVLALLGSFSTSELTSPWVPAMIVCAVLAMVCVIIWRIKPLKWLILIVVNALLLTFVLLILVPVCLSMTDVNGVSLGATLERMISMLSMMAN